MVKKRVTLPEDVDRLAEQLLNKQGELIDDRRSYDIQYSIFMQEGGLEGKRNTILRDKVFKQITIIKPEIEPEVRKKVTKKLVKPKPAKFEITARSKGRIVFARRTKLTRRGKQFTFLRDKKGRFAKKTEK